MKFIKFKIKSKVKKGVLKGINKKEFLDLIKILKYKELSSRDINYYSSMYDSFIKKHSTSVILSKEGGIIAWNYNFGLNWEFNEKGLFFIEGDDLKNFIRTKKIEKILNG